MAAIGEKIATREAYGNALAEFGAKYENVVVLDADLAEATKTVKFKKAFPERFFDCGIAEGNMVAIAAGIATTGKIPFCSSFAMFTAGRAFEQIRNAVGYPHLNVKIGATHAGITVGEDGATHQCLEDIGTMRTIPGMTIINPADAVEARAAVEAAINFNGPVYMRFGRLAVPVIYDEASYKLEIGRGIKMADGSDVTIIATGVTVAMALEARATLAAEGIDAAVVNIHTIKPLDRELVIAEARKTGAIVTAENHNVTCGLGSVVANCLARNCPTIQEFVGVQDQFGQVGPQDFLMDEYGLRAANIVAAVKKAVARK